MLKVLLKLDVNLSKVVFGFVGLSAAAAAVYYLSLKNENQSNMKFEDAFSSNGMIKCNNLTVDKSEVDKQTHIANENTSESNDASHNENNSLQYENEEFEGQIFSDKNKSFSLTKDSHNLKKCFTTN